MDVVGQLRSDLENERRQRIAMEESFREEDERLQKQRKHTADAFRRKRTIEAQQHQWAVQRALEELGASHASSHSSETSFSEPSRRALSALQLLEGKPTSTPKKRQPSPARPAPVGGQTPTRSLDCSTEEANSSRISNPYSPPLRRGSPEHGGPSKPMKRKQLPPPPQRRRTPVSSPEQEPAPPPPLPATGAMTNTMAAAPSTDSTVPRAPSSTGRTSPSSLSEVLEEYNNAEAAQEQLARSQGQRSSTSVASDTPSPLPSPPPPSPPDHNKNTPRLPTTSWESLVKHIQVQQQHDQLASSAVSASTITTSQRSSHTHMGRLSPHSMPYENWGGNSSSVATSSTAMTATLRHSGVGSVASNSTTGRAAMSIEQLLNKVKADISAVETGTNTTKNGAPSRTHNHTATRRDSTGDRKRSHSATDHNKRWDTTQPHQHRRQSSPVDATHYNAPLHSRQTKRAVSPVDSKNHKQPQPAKPRLPRSATAPLPPALSMADLQTPIPAHHKRGRVRAPKMALNNHQNNHNRVNNRTKSGGGTKIGSVPTTNGMHPPTRSSSSHSHSSIRSFSGVDHSPRRASPPKAESPKQEEGTNTRKMQQEVAEEFSSWIRRRLNKDNQQQLISSSLNTSVESLPPKFGTQSHTHARYSPPRRDRSESPETPMCTKGKMDLTAKRRAIEAKKFLDNERRKHELEKEARKNEVFAKTQQRLDAFKEKRKQKLQEQQQRQRQQLLQRQAQEAQQQHDQEPDDHVNNHQPSNHNSTTNPVNISPPQHHQQVEAQGLGGVQRQDSPPPQPLNVLPQPHQQQHQQSGRNSSPHQFSVDGKRRSNSDTEIPEFTNRKTIRPNFAMYIDESGNIKRRGHTTTTTTTFRNASQNNVNSTARKIGKRGHTATSFIDAPPKSSNFELLHQQSHDPSENPNTWCQGDKWPHIMFNQDEPVYTEMSSPPSLLTTSNNHSNINKQVKVILAPTAYVSPPRHPPSTSPPSPNNNEGDHDWSTPSRSPQTNHYLSSSISPHQHTTHPRTAMTPPSRTIVNAVPLHNLGGGVESEDQMEYSQRNLLQEFDNQRWTNNNNNPNCTYTQQQQQQQQQTQGPHRLWSEEFSRATTTTTTCKNDGVYDQECEEVGEIIQNELNAQAAIRRHQILELERNMQGEFPSPPFSPTTPTSCTSTGGSNYEPSAALYHAVQTIGLGFSQEQQQQQQPTKPGQDQQHTLDWSDCTDTQEFVAELISAESAAT